MIARWMKCNYKNNQLIDFPFDSLQKQHLEITISVSIRCDAHFTEQRKNAIIVSVRTERERVHFARCGGGVCVCRHLKRESDEIIIADRGVSVRAARDAGTILLICPLMEKPCATWSEWCRPAGLWLLSPFAPAVAHTERSCVRLLRSPGESRTFC